MSGVSLRALTMYDVELTYKWHSDQELYETLGGTFRYVSMDAEREWLAQKSTYSNSEINLMICLKETNLPIGLVSVREVNWISRCGYLSGIFIGESDQRGKGYGSEALSLMVNHCFMDLGLNRVYSHILKENRASITMFTECGFREEGLLCQHVFKKGRFMDVLVVGLCLNQYTEKTVNDV